MIALFNGEVSKERHGGGGGGHLSNKRDVGNVEGKIKLTQLFTGEMCINAGGAHDESVAPPTFPRHAGGKTYSLAPLDFLGNSPVATDS